VISIAGKAVAAALVLFAPGASAQEAVEGITGLTVETKISPKRFILTPWKSYADDIEFVFYIDDQAPDFSWLNLQCQVSGPGDGFVYMSLRVNRSEFKPSSNGKLVAVSGPHFVPPAGHSGGKCRILKART
jgi:hypothetical protein